MPGEWVGGPGSGRRAGFAFVGRGGELRALTATLREGPAVVFVEGEAGLGKSRLLREAAARLKDEGLVVLRGWCHPLREPLPFGPVVDALRDAHALFGPGTHLSPATAALHPYLPELAGRLPEETDEPGAGPQQQLMRAVQDLLGALGPVVLMVEDLHWADDATRDLLLLLARNPPKGLRLVLSYRAHDLSGARNVLGVPYRRPVGVGGTEITLAPLTEEHVRELAASAIGPAAAARLGRKLFERSGGLPLAAEEDLLVLADRVEDGACTGASSLLEEAGVPRALQEAVNSRVAVLGPGAVAVVEAAAVLAVPTSEEQLALLAGLADEQAEEALTAALLADVLVERGPGRYGFRHVLARQAVYERIPGPRRRRLHVRAIEALTGRQTPALVQIAHHTRRLGDVTAWLPTARAAADHAAAVGDDGVAAELLQQLLAEAALPSEERARTALELSRIAMYRADSSTSSAILGRIIADPALPSVVRGEIRFNLSRALVDSSADRSHSVAQMQQAITELADRPGLAAVAMSALSMVSGRGSRISTTGEDQALMAEAVRTVARSDDPLARATVLTNRITLMGMTGDAKAGELLAELPRSSPDRAVQRECARALYNAAYGAMLRGNDRARALHDEAEEAARRTGYQIIEQGCAVIRLRLDLAEGQWAGLDDGLAAVLPETADGTKFRIAALMVRAALEVARGYWAAARQHLATFTTTDEENASWDVGQAGVTLLGRIDLLEGDPEAAWERLRRPLAARRHKGVWVRAHDLTPTAVQAALACGLPAEAERLTDEAATGIEGRDAPAAAAEVLWCRGMTTAATDPAAALAHLALAQARYEALGRVHTAARVAEQAGCLQLRHNPGEAGRHIQHALDVFTRLGATADAARCRQALRETGQRRPDPGRRHSYGPELSPRERQVAELLATGAGNQAIARVLGLSTRTAEHHVANTLKKLGLRRDQVRGAFEHSDGT
ncbi:AAA family ATPase [Kitasatospora sp. NBC_00240]|uniref:ATP-binding protein n=1 Tax=Kitasatospora sp. NBC_00240 TaxID=2903567 RepID=UPI002259C2A5|nr:LuxR family transcriptional regulator [Kitasatospora sp. NBC_00240]MCX5208796.1 AAA family ATPase [Kitasatospora sp. NBC_00240]